MTVPLSLEYILSQQANDAIAQGADPRAVSDRLRTLALHARSNADLRVQAEDALAQGADPAAVAERFASLARGAPQATVPPDELARIQSNVARMREQNAPESDVLAYLQHEDSLASQAPARDTSISARNLLRSAGQGASFGFSDELGLADRDAQKAFAAEHPIADFAAKLGGGALAPILATLALPELASLSGAAALGAGIGGLTGAGEAEGGAADRAKSAAIGTGLGAAGGALGYGAAKVLGGVGGRVLKWFTPKTSATRATGALARDLIDDPAGVQARMDAINALAPGGSSPATAAVSEPLRSSQFLQRAADSARTRPRHVKRRGTCGARSRRSSRA